MRRILLCATLLTVACTQDNGGNGNGDGGAIDGFSQYDDLFFDNDAFYINDPPPMYCALDGGMFTPPPPPGGTLDCPDDKNREGCPCPTEGMTAACWPGARKNRNLGSCKDGVTTCVRRSELQLGWGPCVGAVLPVPGGSAGAACECFSHGLWKLDNLSPCFIDNGGGLGSGGAVATYIDGGGKAQCPLPAGTQSSSPWTPDTVSADCAGRFKLCYTLKAGDAAMPKATDCKLIESCSEGDYTMVNIAQVFPPLASWKSNDTACASAFAATGGYGEMSVKGITVMCDTLDKVFNRVKYCPLKCNAQPPPMPTPAECMNCMQGGSGQF